MRIRKASHHDAGEICRLHRASIQEICCSAYSPDQIVAWTKPLSPDRYIPAMDQFEFYVAEEERIVGFFILNLKGAELNALYLHPNVIQRGLGRRLYEFAEGLAQDNSLSELKLKATLNSVGFYQSCGFRQICNSIHTNPAGVELPCVEMTKSLKLE